MAPSLTLTVPDSNRAPGSYRAYRGSLLFATCRIAHATSICVVQHAMMVEAVQIKASHLAGEDIHGPRNEYIFDIADTSFDVVGVKGLLNDKRDVPAVNCLLNICCTTLPAAVLLHALHLDSHAVGLLYMVLNYAVFLQRFLLTLHITEHRKLFRPGELYRWLVPRGLESTLGI